jgi:hypothetical protein
MIRGLVDGALGGGVGSGLLMPRRPKRPSVGLSMEQEVAASAEAMGNRSGSINSQNHSSPMPKARCPPVHSTSGVLAGHCGWP